MVSWIVIPDDRKSAAFIENCACRIAATDLYAHPVTCATGPR